MILYYMYDPMAFTKFALHESGCKMSMYVYTCMRLADSDAAQAASSMRRDLRCDQNSISET